MYTIIRHGFGWAIKTPIGFYSRNGNFTDCKADAYEFDTFNAADDTGMQLTAY